MRQVPPHILFIGSGRLSRHLSFYFSSLNIKVKQWSRQINSPEELKSFADESQFNFILIKDDAIETFVESYPFLKSEKTFHCSGSLSIDGVRCLHPLMTFPETLYNLDFYKQIPWAVFESDFKLHSIHENLKNPSFFIKPELKSLYHALCVSGGNLVQLLWLETLNQWTEKLNAPIEVLIPFLEKSASNFLKYPQKSVITGPIVRGDQTTINKNLMALEYTPLYDVYRSLSKSHLNSNTISTANTTTHKNSNSNSISISTPNPNTIIKTDPQGTEL